MLWHSLHRGRHHPHARHLMHAVPVMNHLTSHSGTAENSGCFLRIEETESLPAHMITQGNQIQIGLWTWDPITSGWNASNENPSDVYLLIVVSHMYRYYRSICNTDLCVWCIYQIYQPCLGHHPGHNPIHGSHQRLELTPTAPPGRNMWWKTQYIFQTWDHVGFWQVQGWHTCKAIIDHHSWTFMNIQKLIQIQSDII